MGNEQLPARALPQPRSQRVYLRISVALRAPCATTCADGPSSSKYLLCRICQLNFLKNCPLQLCSGFQFPANHPSCSSSFYYRIVFKILFLLKHFSPYEFIPAALLLNLGNSNPCRRSTLPTALHDSSHLSSQPSI